MNVLKIAYVPREKRNALSAWWKAVSTADPEVRDVVSVLYDDLETQWKITQEIVGDSAETISRTSVQELPPEPAEWCSFTYVHDGLFYAYVVQRFRHDPMCDGLLNKIA
jgi:hypothetical protein